MGISSAINNKLINILHCRSKLASNCVKVLSKCFIYNACWWYSNDKPQKWIIDIGHNNEHSSFKELFSDRSLDSCLYNRGYLEFNSFYLSNINLNFTINTGITFRQNASNYKTDIFVTDFDGYPTNGSTSFGFDSVLKPISLNTNLHGLYLFALTGPYLSNYSFVNRMRFTYVLVDITSFLLTPITQDHYTWLSGQYSININKDF